MTSEHLTFQSNDEALFAGFDLVKQLFSRYARIQTNMLPDSVMKKPIILLFSLTLLCMGCSKAPSEPSTPSVTPSDTAHEPLPETDHPTVKSFEPDPDALIISFNLKSDQRVAKIDTTSFSGQLSKEDLYSDYSLDCDGDGQFEKTNLHDSSECVYEQEGSHRLQIKGVLPRLLLSSISDSVNIEQWGTIPWKSMAYMGSGCTHLTISAKDTPNLSSVKSMRGMFKQATQFNDPIDHWDVSHVTDMSELFFYAESFNQPLDSWNVSNVENMEKMFSHATAFNAAIGKWNVSKVKNFSEMFSYATSFNQSIRNWRPGEADMRKMFFHAETFNHNLSHWSFKDKQLVGFFMGANSFKHEATLEKIQNDIEDGSSDCYLVDQLFDDEDVD